MSRIARIVWGPESSRNFENCPEWMPTQLNGGSNKLQHCFRAHYWLRSGIIHVKWVRTLITGHQHPYAAFNAPITVLINAPFFFFWPKRQSMCRNRCFDAFDSFGCISFASKIQQPSTKLKMKWKLCKHLDFGLNPLLCCGEIKLEPIPIFLPKICNSANRTRTNLEIHEPCHMFDVKMLPFAVTMLTNRPIFFFGDCLFWRSRYHNVCVCVCMGPCACVGSL